MTLGAVSSHQDSRAGGLAYREVLGGQVGAGERGAGQRAMRRTGRGLITARQARDDGAGLAVQGRQARAVAQGLRLRHRDAAFGQLVHQLDIERQLRVASAPRTASRRIRRARCRK